jgi:tetratricopeptide (TPR) repeat protein
MRKSGIILAVFAAVSLSGRLLARAETIYYKDGKTLKGKILYRDQGSLRVREDSGLTEVKTDKIEKILNDDGSISKYDYKSLNKKIQVLIARKEYKDAAGLCSLLLESFPEEAKLRYLRGLLNQKTGNPAAARQDYEYLIKQNLADAKVFNNLGSICAGRKEYKQAADWFIKAIQESPAMAEAHENLAVLSLETEDYNSAIAEYNKVIGLQPGNFNALYNLGMVYLNQGDYPKAKEQLEKALSVKPDDINTKKGLDHLAKIGAEKGQ